MKVTNSTTLTEKPNPSTTRRCVLLFSGGRDSTLAAIRLANEGFALVLVTVTTNYLVGLEKVLQRLSELAGLLPSSTQWIHVVPGKSFTESDAKESCLPCQQKYVVIGMRLTDIVEAQDIALGYSGYQSNWIEQSQRAVNNLTDIANSQALHLHLPVYDVSSKEEMVAALRSYNLTDQALEQKCLRQQLNPKLDDTTVRHQLDIWKKQVLGAINTNGSADFRIRKLLRLGSISSQ